MTLSPSQSLYRRAQASLEQREYQRAIDLARYSLKLSRNEAEQASSINLLSHIYYYVKAPKASADLIDGFQGTLANELAAVFAQRRDDCRKIARYIDEATSCIEKASSALNPASVVLANQKVAIIGDSHVFAFKNAYCSRKHRVIQVAPPLAGASQRLVSSLDELQEYEHLLVSVCGNMHTILSLSHDFRCPNGSQWSYLRSEIIDYFIRAICYALYPAIKQLQSRVSSNTMTYLMEPPPPKKYQHILNLLPQSQGAIEGIASGYLNCNEHDYVDVWKLFSASLEACASAFDLSYLPSPANCQDEEGFLLSRYHRDLTHANPFYGELVFKHFL